MGDFCILLILCALRQKAPQKAAKKPHFGPIFRKNQGLRSSETSHRSQNPSHGSPFPWDVSVSGPIFASKSSLSALKRPPTDVAIFWKIEAPSQRSGSHFRAKRSPGRCRSVARPSTPAAGRPGPHHRAPRALSPATSHRKHSFFGQKALSFAISVLQNHTKKQFFLQKPTSKPRKGRNNPYLLAHRNFLFLHLQMKYHGEKAKQTRFTQPRRNLTSKRHCE